jgi:hypothetical protein
MKIKEKELNKVIKETEDEIRKESGLCYSFAVYRVCNDFIEVSYGRPNGGDVWLVITNDTDCGEFDICELSGIEDSLDIWVCDLLVKKINDNLNKIVK